MPNQPKTPQKTFRVPEDLYKAVKTKAQDNGETVSDVVRRAMEQYIESSDSPEHDGDG